MLTTVRLEPDVAEIFLNADAVNEALRVLIRIMQENPAIVPKVPANTALDMTDEK
ncbi:hypothetical protein [Microcoleus sp. FACHB-68]|uniref:hypothetical protein n=1 Tax=Microcoleus sp. FACHB-68 TaxID=2692826 RepID=UPI001F557232|nr:hypothetical protein [Microcoleus sp. FACHB-68]